MATHSTQDLTESMTAVDMKTDLSRLYSNVEFLTRGGFGYVFTANDEQNTAKILKVTQVHTIANAQELTEEFNLMVMLDHPYIAQVYNLFSINNICGFEMKVYPIGDLHTAILQRTFTPLHTLALASEVLSGLAYIHSNQIVHRDIKPGNILLDSRDRGVISDFGLATHVEEIIFGDIVGTEGYIAPEVLACMEYDTKPDIWSFARILHAVFSGQPDDPLHLHHELVPDCFKELIKNADCQNPYHRKSALWFTMTISAGDSVVSLNSSPKNMYEGSD